MCNTTKRKFFSVLVVYKHDYLVFPSSGSWKRNIKQITDFFRAPVCPKALLSKLPENLCCIAQ